MVWALAISIACVVSPGAGRRCEMSQRLDAVFSLRGKHLSQAPDGANHSL